VHRMPRRTIQILLSAVLVLILSSCAGLPKDMARSTRNDPDALGSLRSLTTSTAGPWPQQMWWQELGDPQLDHLIEEALAGNPTLRVAESRIRQAAALAGLADAARYPQLGAGASSIYQRLTENGAVPPPQAGEKKSVNSLKLEFSYDLDLWGRNRAGYEAALGAVRVAEIEGELARLTLASNIAKAYIRLNHEFERLKIETGILRQREQMVELTAKRVTAGLDTAVELKHSQGVVASTRADIRAGEERIALLRNQLAALAGCGPDRGAALKPPILLAQKELTLPTEIPSELIGRRPDVVAQLWRIELMTKEVEVAKASFYPNISLTAFAGFDSIGIENFVRSGSGVFGAGPAITLPIFDGGRLRSNLSLRSAEYDENVERYNSLIVDAIREVGDQIVSWRGVEAQLAEEREAEAKLGEANGLALLRYRQGLTSYLTVLATEGDLLRERLQTVALRARQFEVAVNLSTSLGGGYRPEPPAVLKSKYGQIRSTK